MGNEKITGNTQPQVFERKTLPQTQEVLKYRQDDGVLKSERNDQFSSTNPSKIDENAAKKLDQNTAVVVNNSTTNNQSSQSETHKVVAGDTLWKILAGRGFTGPALLEAIKKTAELNQLADPNKLKIDQVLKMPESPKSDKSDKSKTDQTAPTQGNWENYTIKKGDSLSKLLMERGFTGEELKSALQQTAKENKLTNPDMIVEGKPLRLPAKKGQSDKKPTTEQKAAFKNAAKELYPQLQDKDEKALLKKMATGRATRDEVLEQLLTGGDQLGDFINGQMESGNYQLPPQQPQTTEKQPQNPQNPQEKKPVGKVDKSDKTGGVKKKKKTNKSAPTSSKKPQDRQSRDISLATSYLVRNKFMGPGHSKLTYATATVDGLAYNVEAIGGVNKGWTGQIVVNDAGKVVSWSGLRKP